MLSVLDKIIREIQHGPYERKVKQYLNDATQGQSALEYHKRKTHPLTIAHLDSVLDDLQKLLEPNLRIRERLWAIFDEYCVKDSAGRPCMVHFLGYRRRHVDII